jgi:hypothetical protein
MPENAPVIVSYSRLSKAMNKALAKDPDSIIKAMARGVEGSEGYESTSDSETSPKTEAQVREDLERALHMLEAKERAPGVLVSPDDRLASLLQSYLAEQSMQIGKVERLDEGGLEAKFDEHDILGWAGSLFSWIKKFDPHVWVTAPATPDTLPNSLRVAILGDWGSGLYGAPFCAKSIEADPRGYQLLLHLGDVYYSGTEKEVRNRFLELWPKINGATSRACNSNHEMYTGGHAYFKQTLAQFKQQGSYFALRNDHWLLIGLDSAYKEGDLAMDQVSWLSKILADANGRRVVLFTHHQLFSWKEKQTVKLQTALAQFLKDRLIFAWYWGHEHRCMIYDQHTTWGLYGRCIGHSGYPYFRDSFSTGQVIQKGPQETGWRKLDAKNLVPGGLVLEGPNPYIVKHESEYGPHGYMTLEFLDNQLNEIVHTPDGSIAYERRLV